MTRANSPHLWAWLMGLSALLFLLPLPAPAQVLEQLIVSALASHPTAQGQRALVQAAQSGVDSARWQFYPTPSVSVEAAQASAFDSQYRGDSRVSILRLQQPLWAGGRLSGGLDKAQASLLASQATLDEARLQLGLRVVQAYGDWLAAHLKTLAFEKSRATHQRLREQVQRRLAQGAAAQSDVTLALARLAAVAADVTAAQAQAEIALARLGQLLGAPIDGAALAHRLATPLTMHLNVPTLLEHALSINPTVSKARAQAQVQEAVMAERRADLAPEVYARAERQFGNFSFPNGAPQNRVFLGVTSRFGAGLSNLSNVEAAMTQHAAALSEIEVQSRTVNEQVLSDHATVRSSSSRMAALKAALQSATDVSASYDRQFLAGRKSWLDVMNAARELAQTETQLADLQATQLVASWRLGAYAHGIDHLTQGDK